MLTPSTGGAKGLDVRVLFAALRTSCCLQEDEMKYLKKQDYGRVPSYLLERKIELAAQQEAEERMKEAALIPPGKLVHAHSSVMHICVSALTWMCMLSA
eukprot:648410-Pelagomonas_calceolata.AAC.1